MAVNEPVTIYRPQTEGEMSSPGTADIVDTTGKFLVDPSGNQIVDTGTLFTATPATIYTENDGI